MIMNHPPFCSDSIYSPSIYLILKVDDYCSVKDLLRAYKKEALRNHPDKGTSEGDEMMTVLNNIKSMLESSDVVELKRVYDNGMRECCKAWSDYSAAVNKSFNCFKDSCEDSRALQKKRDHEERLKDEKRQLLKHLDVSNSNISKISNQLAALRKELKRAQGGRQTDIQRISEIDDDLGDEPSSGERKRGNSPPPQETEFKKPRNYSSSSDDSD
jgi:hypothetical protein